jgi:uncharacterized protein (DUF1015 family)
MASIHPFRALRPEPDAASDVSSVPYDVVTTEEARRLAAGNRLSFLHVTRSEIDLPDSVDPYADAVYEKAHENLQALREQAPLRVEDSPSLYLYALRMGNHEQTGVAGCFSVDEYEADVIKKHERTRRDKEDDRTRHIVRLRAQTGVVFLTYKAAPPVDEVTTRIRRQKPLFDFTATDGVHHILWRATDADARALVDAFGAIPELYIADGHHRAASAARARAQLRDKSPEADTFIAVAFPDNQMQILPYHRLVKDLAGRTPEQFLAELRRVVPVVEGEAQPRRRGEMSMYLGGRWYWVDLSAARPADDTHASTLDVARLQHSVLELILGIGDVRSDKRIDFLGGARGTGALEKLVQSQSAAVAFSMYPVTIADLMQISDAGGIMPPKSTWFEPKLRDGLLTHVI